MRKKYWRLYGLLLAALALGTAAGLVFLALGDNLSYFHNPSEVAAGNIAVVKEGRNFRLGGLVKEGSIKRAADGVTIDFIVTDLAEEVPVRYSGVIPDLFRDKQGVIAEGRMEGKIFVAHRLLAKHDENYMPPEVARSLKTGAKP